jgi:hypothetical protein
MTENEMIDLDLTSPAARQGRRLARALVTSLQTAPLSGVKQPDDEPFLGLLAESILLSDEDLGYLLVAMVTVTSDAVRMAALATHQPEEDLLQGLALLYEEDDLD